MLTKRTSLLCRLKSESRSPNSVSLQVPMSLRCTSNPVVVMKSPTYCLTTGSVPASAHWVVYTPFHFKELFCQSEALPDTICAKKSCVLVLYVHKAPSYHE